MIKSLLTEDLIINKYLKKLSFKKRGTYEFKNDAAYIQYHKNKKIVVTTDSISENIDFFKNDNPKSIAAKIVTVNLSDLSSMGVFPLTYTLNIFLPLYIDENWLRLFTKELLTLQKKYKFYLLGGDLSKSKKLSITSTFFGLSNKNKIIKQNFIKKDNDIWVTGNLGDSYVGLQILQNKINLNNLKIKNYFLKKYYYPKHSTIGPKIAKYVVSMKDISDGFIGDLKKMLNYKYGAKINLNKLPVSIPLNGLIQKKILNKKYIINSGDNYQLILISKKKYRKKITAVANKNKIKITLIGKVTKNLKLTDDSDNPINIPNEFDHFS